MDALITSPTSRLTAILVSVGAAIIILIYIVTKVRALASDLGLVKHEVKNDHKTNFREEQDTRHDENKAALSRLEKKVDKVLGVLGAHDYRIDELEHTLDPRKGLHPPP